MNKNDMLILVAEMYYEQDITQTDIAKKLNISRPTVASLLKKAKETGIVRINVMKAYSNVIQIQKEIREKYHLNSAFVTSENSSSPKKDVGVLSTRNYLI